MYPSGGFQCWLPADIDPTLVGALNKPDDSLAAIRRRSLAELNKSNENDLQAKVFLGRDCHCECRCEDAISDDYY